VFFWGNGYGDFVLGCVLLGEWIWGECEDECVKIWVDGF